MVRLGVIILGLLFSASASYAQKTSKPGSSVENLKKNITIISRKGEEGDGSDLIAQTVKELVAYLKSHELSAVEAKKLGIHLAIDSKDDAHFRVYSFNFNSGGTWGQVYVPVIQWKNQAGKLFAYAPTMECEFSEIHKLNSPGRTMYLLLGNGGGHGHRMQRIAYVMELKGNYLLLNNPIFDKTASLNLPGIWMKFDIHQQMLYLDLTEFDFDYFEPNDEPYRLLKRWGFINQMATKRLSLKFNGRCFVRP